MAYYPKYNKKKKSKKAIAGAATAALGLGKMAYGAIQAGRARKAQKDFDQDRLKMGVSQATQQMADEPIDQSYIERMQQQQAADRASAMGALSKDPRNVLAGVQALEGQAARQRTNLMGMQDEARRRAMQNLSQEQRSVEGQRLAVAGQEIEGIRGEKAAGTQNIFGGAEDVLSGVASMAKGGKIDAEEGGVTPGKFDHKDNPIDMVQDGEKIGEATGGELILPPDDVDDIRMALQNEDKDAAFDLMKDLVAKYDSNTIGGDDKEMAQEGATISSDAIPKDKAAKIMKYVMRKDYYGSPAAPDYVDIAREELNLTDKESEFLVKYAESRKKSAPKRKEEAFAKRREKGIMGGDLNIGGYLKRMASKLKS